jgi:hypothetical protein
MAFPSRRHPDIERTERHARDWISCQGLISASDPEILTLPRLGRLAAFAYPDASSGALDLAADWIAWLYVFDDLYADQGQPDPAALSGHIAALLDVLDGSAPATPLSAALSDLVARYRALANSGQAARFVASVSGYLLGVLAEVAYRSAGRVPTVAEYLPLRLQASACLPCLCLAEVCGHSRELDSDEIYHPRIAGLNRLAAYVIALANDVYSCPREIDNAPVPFIFNLPLVLAANEAIPLPAAIVRAVAMTQVYVDKFTREYRAAVTADRSLAPYCESLACWAQGTFDWLALCGRYDAYWDQAGQEAFGMATAGAGA